MVFALRGVTNVMAGQNFPLRSEIKGPFGTCANERTRKKNG